ncbi:MAG: hypothetical protein B7Z80_10380 [Rhodospirillales bacterium 20-64-7]|nr:MAG: hypothetical protein B7Z80_10380 [Rhodospirillales bacterium 20-64-7]
MAWVKAALINLDEAQEQAMVYKVNYGLERAERNRAKEAKKAAKAEAKKVARDASVSAETEEGASGDASSAEARSGVPAAPGNDQAS